MPTLFRLALAATLTLAANAQTYDVILRGGTIVVGTGAPVAH